MMVDNSIGSKFRNFHWNQPIELFIVQQIKWVDNFKALIYGVSQLFVFLNISIPILPSITFNINIDMQLQLNCLLIPKYYYVQSHVNWAFAASNKNRIDVKQNVYYSWNWKLQTFIRFLSYFLEYCANNGKRENARFCPFSLNYYLLIR